MSGEQRSRIAVVALGDGRCAALVTFSVVELRHRRRRGTRIRPLRQCQRRKLSARTGGEGSSILNWRRDLGIGAAGISAGENRRKVAAVYAEIGEGTRIEP